MESSASFLTRSLFRAASVAAALCVAAGTSLAAGTWTKIVANPPGGINLMLLMSDGTVLCAKNDGSTIGNGWYRLTPNAAGSYVNGSWSTMASSAYTRLYYPTQVCRDGRVFVAGGEYGTGGPRAEIYDLQTNAWTTITPPGSLWSTASENFYDCNSEILPDGSILVAPVIQTSAHAARTLKYNPATNTWSNAGNLFRGTYQDEATWCKLPDNTILTIDPFGTNSERYNPVSGSWINDSNVPVSLYDPFGFELGGSVYLPNGKAFFLGSTGNTAFYTPTGTTSPGTWTAGPVIPSSRGTPDAPCAMMWDGKVLCAVSAVPTSGNHFPSPTYFYEFDYTTNTFTNINGPTGASDPISAYQAAMLCLPNGQVMYSHMANSVYVYTPSGGPIAAGKPTITSITSNGDGSFHLTGKGINGISEGASYGDDLQMNTNYPIVRINHSNGNTYYARTYNWSSTSIATGNAVLSTEYKPPATMPGGAYSLVVVGNQFASDPTTTAGVGSNPTDVATCPNGSAQFSVTGTGTPNLSYQWRRGITNLTNGGNISGATSATLTISPVSLGDAGTDYNCIVSNVFGSAASGNAALTVCVADYDCNGFVNGDDFDSFVADFELGLPSTDVDGNLFVNGDDFDYFSEHFSAGC